MRKRLFSIIIIFVIVNCLAERGDATPTLLGELRNVAEDTISLNSPPTIGFVKYIFGFGETVILGYENTFQPNTSFSFDFNYSDRDKIFFARLADTKLDGMWISPYISDINGNFLLCHHFIGDERSSPPDLIGAHIDFVRLNVDGSSVAYIQDATSGKYELNAVWDFTLQFWGTEDTPTFPRAVPEPATMPLLVFGFICLAALRKMSTNGYLDYL
jgi:hypothetical protein